LSHVSLCPSPIVSFPASQLALLHKRNSNFFLPSILPFTFRPRRYGPAAHQHRPPRGSDPTPIARRFQGLFPQKLSNKRYSTYEYATVACIKRVIHACFRIQHIAVAVSSCLNALVCRTCHLTFYGCVYLQVSVGQGATTITRTSLN